MSLIDVVTTAGGHHSLRVAFSPTDPTADVGEPKASRVARVARSVRGVSRSCGEEKLGRFGRTEEPRIRRVHASVVHRFGRRTGSTAEHTPHSLRSVRLEAKVCWASRRCPMPSGEARLGKDGSNWTRRPPSIRSALASFPSQPPAAGGCASRTPTGRKGSSWVINLVHLGRFRYPCPTAHPKPAMIPFDTTRVHRRAITGPKRMGPG